MVAPVRGSTSPSSTALPTRRGAGADSTKAFGPTPRAEAVAGAEVVFSCLGDDPDLREVILEQGVIDAMPPGSLLVDHTTASADMARELASAGAERGVQCLDAPVSGDRRVPKRGG